MQLADIINQRHLAQCLRQAGCADWARCLPRQLQPLLDRPHGDWPQWLDALRAMPSLPARQLDVGSACITVDGEVTPAGREALSRALQRLHPWRKGPFKLFGVLVDAEWRADLKWARLRPHIRPLRDHVVLDVGCGNGYYLWRMLGEGARLVIGLDPTPLFLAQFSAVAGQLGAHPRGERLAARIGWLPLGVAAMPDRLAAFDTVFSMGVLYHRRAPLEHLRHLRGALRAGGQLVLETLVIRGARDEVLAPTARYAKMRNVWSIPSVPTLVAWLHHSGFERIQVLDVTVTKVTEQRATPWMRFQSLSDYLAPGDATRTVEGYPAPRRALLTAQAPD